MPNTSEDVVTQLRALPQKLRRTPVHLGDHIRLLQKAADEIERLRNELARAKAPQLAEMIEDLEHEEQP